MSRPVGYTHAVVVIHTPAVPGLWLVVIDDLMYLSYLDRKMVVVVIMVVCAVSSLSGAADPDSDCIACPGIQK
jgi:uncharacterized protein YqgC (DUF456 family)